METEKIEEKKGDTFSFEKKSIEERIAETTKTGLMREGVVCLCKIWRSLELLSFIGMSAMLLWCGSKLGSLSLSRRFWESYREIIEIVVVGLAAALFARIGLILPNSKAKEVVDRLTRLK